MNTILTIGHSTHAIELFLDLLGRHGVTALADVRSVPYSRFNPQFNRERIVSSLKASNIKYVFLGNELGGRSNDRKCYEQGRIRYDRLALTAKVQDGLQRILKGANSYCIAVMCAEKEPLHCHRTLLVGHELAKLGMDIAHILSSGELEPHKETMTRLLSEFELETQDDLFSQHEVRSELIEEAIQLQSQRFGHSINQNTGTEGRPKMRVLTIGFTKKSAQRFFELLRESGVSRIVDVRLNHGSQLAGFAKKNDLAWFARELCGLEYIHEPSLAPTKKMLKDYRNKHMGWSEYESQFMELMSQRQIESGLSKDVLNNGCLLCSEDQPHQCHRRLVAEYLNEHRGGVEIKHLGLAEEI